MAWTYAQRSGILRHNGEFIEQGYSGSGRGKNQPSLQATANLGPIPQGRYRISPIHDSPKTGPGTLDLLPLEPQRTFGRRTFSIQGESRTQPGTAAEGSIVLQLGTRQHIATSADPLLEVIA